MKPECSQLLNRYLADPVNALDLLAAQAAVPCLPDPGAGIVVFGAGEGYAWPIPDPYVPDPENPLDLMLAESAPFRVRWGVALVLDEDGDRDLELPQVATLAEAARHARLGLVSAELIERQSVATLTAWCPRCRGVGELPLGDDRPDSPRVVCPRCKGAKLNRDAAATYRRLTERAIAAPAPAVRVPVL